MAAITTHLTSSRGQLRPFDVRRDLTAVANLVEACFADSLDSEGRRYIQQMHSAARNPHYLRWAAAAGEYFSLPLNGFIWEDDGLVVGNLSLIPFRVQGRRCYLIANVAVDPAYRRQGIARTLTSAAMDYAQRHNTSAVWLHVREENAVAFELYHSQGFREKARRTTWVNAGSLPDSLPDGAPANRNGIRVTAARSQHWSQQRAWLDRIYPPEVTWHLPFNLSALRPDLRGSLYRFLAGIHLRSWVALQGEQLLGVLSWQPHLNHAGHLWMAIAPENEEIAIRALLPYARRRIAGRRQLVLDYPAGHSVHLFREAGFEIRQTLVWMSVKLA